MDDVADVAYDKAVELVADAVEVKVRKEDVKTIQDTQALIESPKVNVPLSEKRYASKVLSAIAQKITEAVTASMQRVRNWLTRPDVKSKAKDEIKTVARSSFRDVMDEAKAQANAANAARRAQQEQTKQNTQVKR